MIIKDVYGCSGAAEIADYVNGVCESIGKLVLFFFFFSFLFLSGNRNLIYVNQRATTRRAGFHSITAGISMADCIPTAIALQSVSRTHSPNE